MITVLQYPGMSGLFVAAIVSATLRYVHDVTHNVSILPDLRVDLYYIVFLTSKLTSHYAFFQFSVLVAERVVCDHVARSAFSLAAKHK